VNADVDVLFWLSWNDGTIAVGTGTVVGENTLMSYKDPSPIPINYLIIGGYKIAGTVTVYYCKCIPYIAFARDMRVPSNIN
jgi:Farnesoic acid 0-methyl transferase